MFLRAVSVWLGYSSINFYIHIIFKFLTMIIFSPHSPFFSRDPQNNLARMMIGNFINDLRISVFFTRVIELLSEVHQI